MCCAITAHVPTLRRIPHDLHMYAERKHTRCIAAERTTTAAAAAAFLWLYWYLVLVLMVNEFV